MDSLISRAALEVFGERGRQCTATNRAGERCGNAPINGGFVCSMHGGKIPSVQKAARERLLAMLHPALDVLFRAIRNAPPCEHCGRSDADRDPVALHAAKLILDRTGFGPQATLTVEPSDNTIARIERVIISAPGNEQWRQYATPVEIQTVDDIIRAAKERGPVVITD